MNLAFITSTGTDCGKTVVTCALARALTQRGFDVAALKPIETGCNPDPVDALALAEACDKPELAELPGFYRAPLPLAPYAITLETALPPPDLAQLAAVIRTQVVLRDVTLAEGAGGLLTPTSAHETVADLVLQLDAPLILVAPDRLGTLSHTLTAVESLQRRGLKISAVILNATDRTPTPATVSNLAILRGRLPCPVITFPYIESTSRSLAEAGRPLVDVLWPRT